MGKRIICFLAFSHLAVGAASAQTSDCSQTLMRWAGNHGFRLENSTGSAQYCRDVIIVGSRIPHHECGTPSELASYALEIGSTRVYWACSEYRR
jgi:hypothetical protein